MKEELVDLPIGRKEFDAFCERIFSEYSLPSNPSYRQAIATMIMHLPPTECRKELKYFADSVKKAMANQVAYEVIQEIRDEEKKKADADANGNADASEPVSDA